MSPAPDAGWPAGRHRAGAAGPDPGRARVDRDGGAASTKFVAKLASGLAKPDGLLIVPPADVIGLLHPLPVRALWGVGPRTAERLESLGIGTVGEIATMEWRS